MWRKNKGWHPLQKTWDGKRSVPSSRGVEYRSTQGQPERFQTRLLFQGSCSAKAGGQTVDEASQGCHQANQPGIKNNMKGKEMIAMPNTATCLICGDESDVQHCHKTGPGELSAADTEHRTLFYGLCQRCLARDGIYEDVRQILARREGSAGASKSPHYQQR